MKTLYLFSTNLWFYLAEIPVIAMLVLVNVGNGTAKQTLHFLPLTLVLAAAAIVIFLFFFRFVTISNEEVRARGIFSSKDREFIKEDSILIIKLKPHRTMKIELWGGSESAPPFDWMRAEDVTLREICLFRERAAGGKLAAKRIAKYFSISTDDGHALFEDGFSFSSDVLDATTEIKNDLTEIKIKFKKIII